VGQPDFGPDRNNAPIKASEFAAHAYANIPVIFGFPNPNYVEPTGLDPDRGIEARRIRSLPPLTPEQGAD